MGERVNTTRRTYSTALRNKKRRERRIRKIKRSFSCMLVVGSLGIGIAVAGKTMLRGETKGIPEQTEGFTEHDISEQAKEFTAEAEQAAAIKNDQYPQELSEMLAKNEEAYEFVTGYPNREKYQNQEIDLTSDYEKGKREGKVPLLMQWDQRWGYDSYGQDMIGVAGCGPTCMAMAYLYLTGDTAMNPKKMSEYAYDNGYYSAGTSWSFFSDGALGLGLNGFEIGLDETKIRTVLDKGGVVICSMRPGDFTTTGHFIVLTEYDKNGFFVNDPNRRKNSEKQWDFSTLSPQIKCLWGITN